MADAPVTNPPVTKPGDAPKEPKQEFTPELTERMKQLEANTDILVQIMGDPDVSALVAAKQRGDTFKLAFGETPGQTGDEPINNGKETADDDDEKPEVKAVLAALDKRLAPMQQNMSMLMGLAETMQKREVDDQIRSTAKEFPDFKKYQKDMAKLAREQPGLSVKQLYALAKVNANDLNFEPASTESEKPSSPPRGREPKRYDPNARTEPNHGRKALANSLAAALEKIEL